MPRAPKDGAQRRNPAGSQNRRVSGRAQETMKKGKGCLCSIEQDTESFLYSWNLGVMMLMQDQPCDPKVLGGFRRVINCVVSSGDFVGFVAGCSDLRSELVQIGDFEVAVSKLQNQRWVRGLATAIRHAVQGNRIVHPSPLFNRVSTFLGWLKRLPAFIRPECESIEAYLSCDQRISSISFDDNRYVSPLSEIWSEWFKDFELLDPFSPRHGSGSTADAGRVPADKWDRLRVDSTARILLHPRSLAKPLDGLVGACKRTSKVVFVPKQFGKDRTICMEPAWLQYLQQGVAAQLIDYTHSTSHPLHRLVNVFDQEVNRELCARAYVEGYATIDLSDASDSVSWRLIRKLCGELPLFRYLHATRSTHTRVAGVEYRMDKFAPMGSALCFPIECYVFASVVELAYRIHFGKASDGHRSGCSVYGDDIICPAEIYHLVVDILTSLGFIVNPQKSFSSGGYYESCGVEYLYGALIETIKHPRSHLLCQDVVSPDRVGLVTDLANALGGLGYFRARRSFLQDSCKKRVRVGSKIVPLSDLLVFGPAGVVPTCDPYVKKHWSNNLQCSVEERWICYSRRSSTPYDFIHLSSGWVERSRERRLRDLHHEIFHDVDPKWSNKAITCLGRYRCYDILRTGDVSVSGTANAGRLRQELHRKVIPAHLPRDAKVD